MCDPNTKNKNGFTPILLAAKENHFQIIGRLLEAGASPNCQDPLTRWEEAWLTNPSRMTPLHLVLTKYNIRRQAETVQVPTSFL